jgi:hypothetical protein
VLWKRLAVLVAAAVMMLSMFAAPAFAQQWHSRAPGVSPWAENYAGGCQEFGEFLSSEAHRQRGGEFGEEVSEDAQLFWPSLAVAVIFVQVSRCDIPS